MLDDINVQLHKHAQTLGGEVVYWRQKIANIDLSVLATGECRGIGSLNQMAHNTVNGSWSSRLSEPVNVISFLCFTSEGDETGAYGPAGD